MTTSSGARCVDDDNIVWGTSDGDDNIVWGTDCGGADCDNIVWGTSDDDNIVWGTARLVDNIVWGTASLIDNIVWGTSDDDNIVWGTSGDDAPVFPSDETEPLPDVDARIRRPGASLRRGELAMENMPYREGLMTASPCGRAPQRSRAAIGGAGSRC